MPHDLKTKATEVDVEGFIAGSAKPADGAAVCTLMRRVTGLEPKMWGPSIVGFGLRQYEMAGGKMGQFMAIGFSPRKTAPVLYIKHADAWDERLARLGNFGERAACSRPT